MKNRIQLRKNIYAYPSWVVSFRDIPIGSAHSRTIAQTATAIAAHHAMIINQANCCPSYLIENVARQMKALDLAQFWTPEAVSGHTVPTTR